MPQQSKPYWIKCSSSQITRVGVALDGDLAVLFLLFARANIDQITTHGCCNVSGVYDTCVLWTKCSAKQKRREKKCEISSSI